MRGHQECITDYLLPLRAMWDAGQFRIINSTIARVLVVHRTLITLSAEPITNLPRRGRTTVPLPHCPTRCLSLLLCQLLCVLALLFVCLWSPLSAFTNGH